MKVLVISASLRENSNSEVLANAFAEGARSVEHEVECLTLKGKDIAFCRGCLACQKLRRCVIDDDANAIMAKMQSADVLAFATPVYYYGMSGLLKTLLDRCNAMYPLPYQFRDVYLLTAAEEEGAGARVVAGLQGWIDCYGQSRLAGTVFADGVTMPGDIEGHRALQAARDLGAQV